jgi:protein-L-isoaspartate(D-aspartate) O-methyltransferase
MVEDQLRGRDIVDERVLAAMERVPRELFVPKGERHRAYADAALPIGHGQTISQPWIVACMAQLLELRGDETVLEVGTGSGYAAAVLSRLCAQVVTIERYDSLARVAAETLEKAEKSIARVKLNYRWGAGGTAHATFTLELPADSDDA